MVWMTVSQYRSHCPDKAGAVSLAPLGCLATGSLSFDNSFGYEINRQVKKI
jgi:hypothetical protein